MHLGLAYGTETIRLHLYHMDFCTISYLGCEGGQKKKHIIRWPVLRSLQKGVGRNSWILSMVNKPLLYSAYMLTCIVQYILILGHVLVDKTVDRWNIFPWVKQYICKSRCKLGMSGLLVAQFIQLCFSWVCWWMIPLYIASLVCFAVKLLKYFN